MRYENAELQTAAQIRDEYHREFEQLFLPYIDDRIPESEIESVELQLHRLHCLFQLYEGLSSMRKSRG